MPPLLLFDLHLHGLVKTIVGVGAGPSCVAFGFYPTYVLWSDWVVFTRAWDQLGLLPFLSLRLIEF